MMTSPLARVNTEPFRHRAEEELTEGGPRGAFRVRFGFATNGRPYLKQVETKSGVWFCDLRWATNLAVLEGWYSPEGLKEALKQDVDAAHDRLNAEEFAYGLQLRDYQRRAVLAIENDRLRREREAAASLAPAPIA